MPMASSTTVRCGNTAGFTGLVYLLIASSSCGDTAVFSGAGPPPGRAPCGHPRPPHPRPHHVAGPCCDTSAPHPPPHVRPPRPPEVEVRTGTRRGEGEPLPHWLAAAPGGLGGGAREQRQREWPGNGDWGRTGCEGKRGSERVMAAEGERGCEREGRGIDGRPGEVGSREIRTGR